MPNLAPLSSRQYEENRIALLLDVAALPGVSDADFRKIEAEIQRLEDLLEAA